MSKAVEMVRHILATIAYRFQTAIREAPDIYGEFEAGNDIRTPNEIIRHMTHVLKYVRLIVDEDADTASPEPLIFSEEVERFHQLLGQLDQDFLALKTDEMELLKKLVQGPLSDVLTHIGQLAMIRRMAGAPIQGQSFYAAEIETGKVGKKQTKPVKPYKDTDKS